MYSQCRQRNNVRMTLSNDAHAGLFRAMSFFSFMIFARGLGPLFPERFHEDIALVFRMDFSENSAISKALALPVRFQYLIRNE